VVALLGCAILYHRHDGRRSVFALLLPRRLVSSRPFDEFAAASAAQPQNPNPKSQIQNPDPNPETVLHSFHSGLRGRRHRGTRPALAASLVEVALDWAWLGCALPTYLPTHTWYDMRGRNAIAVPWAVQTFAGAVVARAGADADVEASLCSS
jgi:hypothetical protein